MVNPAARRSYMTRTDRVQVIDTEDGRTVGEVPGLDGGHGTALVSHESLAARSRREPERPRRRRCQGPCLRRLP